MIALHELREKKKKSLSGTEQQIKKDLNSPSSILSQIIFLYDINFLRQKIRHFKMNYRDFSFCYPCILLQLSAWSLSCPAAITELKSSIMVQPKPAHSVFVSDVSVSHRMSTSDI